jgi:hypothetical protein
VARAANVLVAIVKPTALPSEPPSTDELTLRETVERELAVPVGD